jgi:hydrogenase maturation protease
MSDILVAGIGNVFLGDDGFGVEVVRRMPPRPGVKVVDFGIRSVALAYALTEPWSAVILVDAAPRGGKPGTLYVIEPTLEERPRDVLLEAHAMDPVRVLAAARNLGATLPPIRLVGCEPKFLGSEEELADGLSGPVSEAVEPAVAMVESLISELSHA